MNRIVILGTNGWFDSSLGNTISIMYETPEWVLITDAGYGIAKTPHYLNGNKPVYLFLSHFHLDHIVGLHTLLQCPFNKGLTIIGQPGTRETLQRIMCQPFTIPFDSLPYTVRVLETSDRPFDIPFQLQTLPLQHSSPVIGCRFSMAEVDVCYCPDTGPCDNAVELARDADYLFTECAFLPEQTSDDWPHLNPTLAAEIAVNANAKNLVLVHFEARNYQNYTTRLEAQEAAQKVFPASLAGFDNMEIVL